MAQITRPAKPRTGLLATDGKPHPLQDTLLAVTLVLGVLALATASFRGLHALTSWAGLLGVLTGGYGQLVSVTTRERFGLVVGLGACALGLFFGIHHGGLFG
jgi:vacuolar-type H+-ATPase subunit I/STV1